MYNRVSRGFYLFVFFVLFGIYYVIFVTQASAKDVNEYNIRQYVNDLTDPAELILDAITVSAGVAQRNTCAGAHGSRFAPIAVAGQSERARSPQHDGVSGTVDSAVFNRVSLLRQFVKLINYKMTTGSV